ncbi:hypothetical protein QUF90_16515 [Desulfococcaceae bacterium HSG9]|nr:hypothetical protein [Desulfococcaceae bacterium HSG9]
MLDIVYGILVVFFVLSAIGIGPALILLSNEQRFSTAVAISPTLGFAFTTIVGVYLIKLDIPVVRWAFPWLLISVGISFVLGLSATQFRKIRLNNEDKRLMLIFISGLIITISILVLPMIVGGKSYTVLRGNNWDNISYVALAECLDQEPYSWCLSADDKALLDKHPAYNLAQTLMGNRWATAVSLGWAARIASIPIIHFDWGFTVLFFIITFGPAFLLASDTRLPTYICMLVAIAISTGFWAVIILDTRAMSQISSIPLIMLIGWFITITVKSDPLSTKGNFFLLSVILAALFFSYQEVVPMTVLGAGIFIGVLYFRRSLSLSTMLGYLIAVLVGVSLTIPDIYHLSNFLFRQIDFAISQNHGWEKHVFGFIFDNNGWVGAWGMSFLSLFKIVSLYPQIKTFSFALSILLSLVMLYSISFSLTTKKTSFALLSVTSFASAALIQFVYLMSIGGRWQAVKGLSMGYPFLMITVVAILPCLSKVATPTWSANTLLIRLVKYGVLTWLFTQCFFGVYHIWESPTGKTYLLPENPQHATSQWPVSDPNIDLASFSSILSQNQAKTVWVAIPDIWVATYLAFIYGRDIKLINLYGMDIYDRHSLAEISNLSDTPLPSYLIVEKESWWNYQEANYSILSENPAGLLLLKPKPTFGQNPFLLRVSSKNKVEKNEQGLPVLKFSKNKTVLWLFSPKDGVLIFQGDFSNDSAMPSLLKIIRHSKEVTDVDKRLFTVPANKMAIAIKKGLNMVSLQIFGQEESSFYFNLNELDVMQLTHEIYISDIQSPNGLGILNGKLYFWAGDVDTEIHLKSTVKGMAAIQADFFIYANRYEKSKGLLLIMADSGFKSEVSILKEEPQTISFPVERGINRIIMRAFDKSTVNVQPNGDTYPLLIGVRGIEVRFSESNE